MVKAGRDEAVEARGVLLLRLIDEGVPVHLIAAVGITSNNHWSNSPGLREQSHRILNKRVYIIYVSRSWAPFPRKPVALAHAAVWRRFAILSLGYGIMASNARGRLSIGDLLIGMGAGIFILPWFAQALLRQSRRARILRWP